jgi:hypothetical protein
MARTEIMVNWLHAHRTHRGARVAHSALSPAGTNTPLRSSDAEAMTELVGEAQYRSEARALPAVNELSWLPPLWLSW